MSLYWIQYNNACCRSEGGVDCFYTKSYIIFEFVYLRGLFVLSTRGVSCPPLLQSWELTKQHSEDFAKKWLQQLVVHREDLALLALRLNERNRKEELEAEQEERNGVF